MIGQAHSTPVRFARPARKAGGLLLLAALIFAFHHRSLRYGLFLDDHAHFRQLQESGWSIGELTDACRLELVGGAIELWFLPECTLRFFRPLAFGLMKLTYVLTDWSPAAMHAASLTWHFLASVLLMLLLRRLGGSATLAWAVAALFAIHPGLVAPVQWIACQTELMVTTFLLGATLCYLRFRGWSEQEHLADRFAGRWYWAAGCVACFVVALGCRENAIMLPAVLPAVELLLWRRRRRQMLALYAVLLAIIAGYLVVRSSYLGPSSLPPYPYVYTPRDPGFLRFVFDKACYYLLGEFLLVPIVPFGGMYYLRERPVMFYGLAAAVALLVVAVSLRYWRRRPGLLAPAWLFGFIAPVLPAFASPHHLYLPAVGWAMVVMLAMRGIGGVESCGTDFQSVGDNPRRLWRRGLMWATLVLTGVGFGIMTVSLGEAVRTAQQVEDLVVAEIAATPGLADGDILYVANMPMIAHYARLAVEHQTGLRDLRLCVLTWAPRVLGLVGTDIQSELTWVNDRTVEFRLAGDRYFAGAIGHLVAVANGLPVSSMPVESAVRQGFLPEVLEQDAQGIRALRFTFDSPLSDSRTRLFWGSRVRAACEVRPEGAK